MHYPCEVEKLPYAYTAWEPFLSCEILRFHHDKHYVAYVNKLNEILKNYPNLQNMSLEELLINTEALPNEAKTSSRQNCPALQLISSVPAMRG